MHIQHLQISQLDDYKYFRTGHKLETKANCAWPEIAFALKKNNALNIFSTFSFFPPVT